MQNDCASFHDIPTTGCLKLLKSGDHIICSDDVYGGTYRLFDQLLVNYDLHFSFVDTSFPHEVENAITPKTKMIWVETPTNPLLKITDLNAISKIAKKNKSSSIKICKNEKQRLKFWAGRKSAGRSGHP